MKQIKCKCSKNSPFLWALNPKPSIFVKDMAFRAKNIAMNEKLTKEENIIAYKQFSIHSRAHPTIKPSLNKHEL